MDALATPSQSSLPLDDLDQFIEYCDALKDDVSAIFSFTSSVPPLPLSTYIVTGWATITLPDGKVTPVPFAITTAVPIAPKPTNQEEESKSSQITRPNSDRSRRKHPSSLIVLRVPPR